MKALLIILFNLFNLVFYCTAARCQYFLKWENHEQGLSSFPVMEMDHDRNLFIGSGIFRMTDYNCLMLKINSSGNLLWKKNLDFKYGSTDYLRCNFVDRFGNVYYSGFYQASGESFNIMTLKYSANGDSLWSRDYNGNDNKDDFAYAMYVDDSMFCYVTGTSFSLLTGYDYITIKYNPEGIEQWIAKYNDPDNEWDISGAVLTDKNGNVYISGTSSTSQTAYDIVTIKYNRFGAQQWIKRFGSPGFSEDTSPRMILDSNSQLCLTGNTGGNAQDIVTIKYDTSGNQLWFDTYNSSAFNYDYAETINADRLGNLYIGGFSKTTSADYDFTLIKYNPAGVRQWVRNYGEISQHDDKITSAATDSAGNVYVLGTSEGLSGNEDYTIIKYNPSGDTVWLQHYDYLSRNDKSSKILVSPSGSEVFVTGYSDSVLSTLKYEEYQNFPYLKIKVINEGLYSFVFNQMARRDTMTISLRSINSPFQIIDSCRSVIDSTGFTGVFNFPSATQNQYYIVAKDLNCLETWSKPGGVSFQINDTTFYDFTNSISQAYGNNLKLSGSKYCLFSGDINYDGTIDISDLIAIYNDANNFSSGFINTDLNGDGFVDLIDIIIAYNNTRLFPSVIRP